jgi:hypothetical protein
MFYLERDARLPVNAPVSYEVNRVDAFRSGNLNNRLSHLPEDTGRRIA